MPLGMEVGLSPGDFVLDQDPASPPQKRAETPNFRPMSIVAAWIKMPLGTKVGLSPGDIVSDGDQALPKKWHTLNFWPMSIVAKRLYVSGYHLVRR